MIIRKLRLEQGWTQQELGEYAGLSTRTIQRLEKGQVPSEESAKCLGAVFNVDANDILAFYANKEPSEDVMNKLSLTREEQRAMREVDDLKAWYQHALSYALVVPGLWAINFFNSPEYWWALWPTMGWGLGVAVHGLQAHNVFSMFGPEWEQRQINKRLNKR